MDKRNSFPSGHATAAFAVATVQSRYHPEQAPWWYLGATAISISRVSLHRHYVHDVVAGAALGYFTARATLAHPHVMALAPGIGEGTAASPSGMERRRGHWLRPGPSAGNTRRCGSEGRVAGNGETA